MSSYRSCIHILRYATLITPSLNLRSRIHSSCAPVFLQVPRRSFRRLRPSRPVVDRNSRYSLHQSQQSRYLSYVRHARGHGARFRAASSHMDGSVAGRDDHHNVLHLSSFTLDCAIDWLSAILVAVAKETNLQALLFRRASQPPQVLHLGQFHSLTLIYS